MARDCYDDCIAFLDDQLGELLDELHRQGLLDNTLVIITSDHGEAFGEHRFFGHGNAVYLDEIGGPARDPLSRRTCGPRRGRASQSPRPAGHRPRPARSCGRLTVPGPLAGGLLEAHAGRETRRSRAPPSPSRL